MSQRPIDRIRLGPLERAVMEHVWGAKQRSDVVSVHDAVGRPRSITRNTIHSTLERLVRKGLVARHRRGRAYHYDASLSRSAWIAELLDVMSEQFGGEHHDAVLAGFVDFAARTGEQSLSSLEAMVHERRRNEDDPEDG